MSYFATEREGDELCAAGQRARDVEYEVFARYAEAEFAELDLELECRRVGEAFGRSKAWVEQAILAYYRLGELPALKALQAETRRLDVVRLDAIGETVDRLHNLPREEVLEELDAFLVEMFTPKKAGQILPSAMAIRRRLNELVRKIDASLAPDPKKTKQRKDEKDRPLGACETTFYGLNDLEAGLSITGNVGVIASMERYVDRVAKEGKLTQSEAVQAILTGQLCTNTKIVLHVFAQKTDPSSYFIPNFGWTDADGTAWLESLMEESPPQIIDLDAAAASVTDAYVPTDAMKAYVQARDGTCVYPGCDVPSTKCQLDHRIPFDDGGPTTPANLFSLCQRHHNIKTDRRAFYVPDPATGEIVWLFADGTYSVVEPNGILEEFTSPDKPRWRQTIAQRRERKAVIAEFNARCHAAVERFEADNDYEVCVAELEKLEKTSGLKFQYWPEEPIDLKMHPNEWKELLRSAYLDGHITAEEAGIEEPVPF